MTMLYKSYALLTTVSLSVCAAFRLWLWL